MCPLLQGSMNVLIIGTGQYTTGLTTEASMPSDKAKGVVLLSFYNAQKKFPHVLSERIILCGRDPKKSDATKKHVQTQIIDYYSNLNECEFEYYPKETNKYDSSTCKCSIHHWKIVCTQMNKSLGMN